MEESNDAIFHFAWTEVHGDGRASCGDQSDAHGLSVPELKVANSLESVGESVSQIENSASPFLVGVFLDDFDFDGNGPLNDPIDGFCLMFFQVLKKIRSRDDAVFDDLG